MKFLVGNVINQYVSRREVWVRDLEVTIPKAIAMCVATLAVDSLRMKHSRTPIPSPGQDAFGCNYLVILN